MISNELLDARQGIADDVNGLIHKRITESVPVLTLSPREDKVLEVRQDINGNQFVVRAFSADAISQMEREHMSFAEAWGEMHEIFANAGIRVLPSHLLETSGDYPYTVVSEYLDDGQELLDAPTEAKIALAQALGNLFRGGRYVASLEMFNRGMFLVSPDEVGTPTPFLVDVDPRIIPRMQHGSFDAMYIDKLGELFWDHWCREEERAEVISALVVSISQASRFLGEDFDPLSPIGQSFMNLLMMSNGVDHRELNLFR